MGTRNIQSLGVIGAASLLAGLCSIVALNFSRAIDSPSPAVSLASMSSSALADDLLQLAVAAPERLQQAAEKPDDETAAEPTSPNGVADAPSNRAASAPSSAPQQPRRSRQAQRSLALPQNPQELIDCCMEVARDIDPDLAQQLAGKRVQNPEEFERSLLTGHVGRSLLAMAQLKQRDPHLYRTKVSEVTQELQINRATAALQEAMRSSDQRKIDELTDRLKNMLQIQLALSIKARGEHLQRIEEELNTLRAEIEHDAKNFREIVDARLKQRVEQPTMTDASILLPPPQREPRLQREP